MYFFAEAHLIDWSLYMVFTTSHTAQLATDCNELLGNQRAIIMHVFCRLDISQAKMPLLASQHGVAGPRMKPRETKMLPLCTRWHFWTTNHGTSKSNAAVVCWDCASGCGDTNVIGSAGSVPVVYDAHQRGREKAEAFVILQGVWGARWRAPRLVSTVLDADSQWV